MTKGKHLENSNLNMNIYNTIRPLAGVCDGINTRVEILYFIYIYHILTVH